MQDPMRFATSSEMQDAFEQAEMWEDEDQYAPIEQNLRRKIFFGTFFFYGSRVMGIATESSDLDIYIEMENSFDDTLSIDRIEFYINLLEKKMRRDRQWQVQIAITNTPVPFIRAYFSPLQIRCDITFSNGLCVQNTRILRHLFEIQPEAAKLAIFVKKWFAVNGFNFKNYNTVLLVVFFLEQHNFLPSIEEVINKGRYSLVIDGHEVGFNDRLNLCNYRAKKLNNFVNVLEAFFEYYRDLNYADYIMNPHNGELEDKYFCDECYHQDCDKPMWLSGSIESSNNTHAVAHSRLKKLIKLCAATWRLI